MAVRDVAVSNARQTRNVRTKRAIISKDHNTDPLTKHAIVSKDHNTETRNPYRNVRSLAENTVSLSVPPAQTRFGLTNRRPVKLFGAPTGMK
jgi:hypothetical protein